MAWPEASPACRVWATSAPRRLLLTPMMARQDASPACRFESWLLLMATMAWPDVTSTCKFEHKGCLHSMGHYCTLVAAVGAHHDMARIEAYMQHRVIITQSTRAWEA
eukprot:95355-Pelagomonas_calceolata.AAC.1